MTKQVIVFTWDDDKRLGYSRFEDEADWTMDMPEVSREVAKIMHLTCPNENIERMIKDMEAKNGKTYRFEVGENEDAWTYYNDIKRGEQK